MYGVDSEEKPNYARRFGADRFTCADAYDPQLVQRLIETNRAIGVGASPPCQPYSTVRADGSETTVSAGIPLAAALLRNSGRHFWVENVLGADSTEMDESMQELVF